MFKHQMKQNFNTENSHYLKHSGHFIDKKIYTDADIFRKEFVIFKRTVSTKSTWHNASLGQVLVNSNSFK